MFPLLWDWGFTNGHASGPQCSVSLGTGTSDEDIWGKSCKFKLLPSSIFLMPVIFFQQHEKKHFTKFIGFVFLVDIFSSSRLDDGRGIVVQ